MSRLEVEAQALEVAARSLRGTAKELAMLGNRTGAALRLVAGAGGDGALSETAAQTGRRWVDGLGQYADAGRALSGATEAAGAAYVMVELQARRTLTPAVSR